MNRRDQKTIIGRDPERRVLELAEQSNDPELVAVYGRRRVGKTFLIREHFRTTMFLELVGLHDATTSAQLASFARALKKSVPDRIIGEPKSWLEAFDLLIQTLETLPKSNQKRILFFDEFPWLAQHRSGFLSAFEHFWNSFAGLRSDLVVVICGSSAAWMIRKVVHARGGLHNRVTRRIRLEPFGLAETKIYLEHGRILWTEDQIAEAYMAFGGIPHYLNGIQRGKSAPQMIQEICFDKDGFLTQEYTQLYAALFNYYHIHETIVKSLAQKWSGMTRNEILKACKLDSGGGFTVAIDELVQSGFLSELPAHAQKTKDTVYRLSDEFSLFYWSWMARSKSGDRWEQKTMGKRYDSWKGYAFESLCLKHVTKIKEALGISGIETNQSAWRFVPTGKSNSERGAQIDLLIERADRCINLCEMKFSSGPYAITKAYADDLVRKQQIFRQRTGFRGTIFVTFVTTYGLVENRYSTSLVASSLQLKDLFRTGR